MTVVERGRLRFGLFELDRQAGELFRDGRRIRLQEQPLQVLLALVDRPGDVVTREELRERLWRNDTFVDFDHGLNTAIKKVRAALGDSADNPRFIETLARRGYRFIAPVTSVVDQPLPTAATLAADVSPPTAHLHSGSFHRRAIVPLLLIVVVGVAILAWQRRSQTMPASSSGVAGHSAVRLAVLPLRVLAGTEPPAEREYLGVGIADAIITRLANMPGLALHPTAAVLAYADRAPDLATLQSALHVEHVLLGTVQPTDAAYRVSLQLVRAADGVATWAHAYDMPRADLLHLQDSVAEQVADVLALELTSGDRERLRRPTTTKAEAFDAYLRGRARMANYTEAKMRLAIADFEEAVRLDQEFALARAALATACAWFSVRYAYEAEAIEWGKRAEQEANAALTRDPELAEAHLAMANVAATVYRGFDWPTVILESDRGLLLNPTLELAHQARMRAFYHSGRFKDSREAAGRARLLNPAPNVELDRVAVAIELFDGNYAAARDMAQALLARTDAPAIRNYLGLARFYLGDASGARDMLASATRGGRPDIRSQAALASVTAATGDMDGARRVLDGVLTSGYMDHHVAYSVGATYAQLRMAEQATHWLERAATTGFSCYPWFARDPLLSPVRGEAAFTQLLERVRTLAAETAVRR